MVSKKVSQAYSSSYCFVTEGRDGSIANAARVVALRVLAGDTSKFEGTSQIIDGESSATLFAYSVTKGNFKQAAEAFASYFHGRYLNK